MTKKQVLELYDYNLPKNLIALKPAKKADQARLLVYDKKEDRIFYSRFSEIKKFIPKDAVLVFNETKVLPAKLFVKKETGGRVELLYVKREKDKVYVLANRRLVIGSYVYLNTKTCFSVIGRKDNYYVLLLKSSMGFDSVLEKYGKTPLPPYLKNSSLSEGERKKRYQSMFAKYKGSIAAPTASLHFTPRLIQSLKRSGIDIKFVTLHVGLGTFLPLTEDILKLGRLHEEHYEIKKSDRAFLNRAKRKGRAIIAVGTTSARALESATEGGLIKKSKGDTRLFIQDGYKFKFIDGLITNFHLPKSSLLMLVAAIIGREKMAEIYKEAIKKKFKFFSFGDGMLIY